MQRKTREKQPLDVSQLTPRGWEIGEKIKLSFSVCPRRTAAGPGCLLEEGMKASEELEINMRDELSANRHAMRECPAKWSGWWRNKCKPLWMTAEMRSLPGVLFGWIVSSAATTSLAEGCQRIHREAGEVGAPTAMNQLWGGPACK